MPPALIVFDIDGTLADPGHRLHHIVEPPKDWEAFFQAAGGDKPILHGVRILRAIHQAGYDIEFWTGRPERIRQMTRTWLKNNIGSWTGNCSLRMRKDGDRRPDVEVKPEYIREREPVVVFEDRASVVDELRDRGLTVYQVAPGNF